MRAVLGVLCLVLLLLLRSAALPRKGQRHSLSLPEEPGAEGTRRENASSQGTARTGRPRRGTRLLSEPGARCLPEDGWALSSPHPWPLGGLEGPVYRVKVEQDGLSPRQLEVVGVLTHYESRFIKALRRHRGWHGPSLRTFGLCPAGEAGAAAHPLQRIHRHVLEPGPQRFLVLHLEEAEPRSVSVREWLFPGQWPQCPRATGEEIFTGEIPRLCLSEDTQYLVLGAAAGSVNRDPEQLRFSASLTIRGGEGGAPLPSTEVQKLLFGSDDKCFTRMTPVLLLLAKAWQEEEEEEALAPSSYLSALGMVDTAPYPPLSPAQAGTEQLPTPTAPGQANTSSPAPGSSSHFLGILTRFIRQLLSNSSEPPPQPGSHHRLDFQAMETLPHQVLNLSEEATLERLVQSEEPSLLLFRQDSGAVLEQHLGHWQPEGPVLELLTAKLRGLIQELRDIPDFQANTALFQQLLSFCYYPRGEAEGEAGEGEPGEGAGGSRKLHTLLLLKALQSVRARWQERRKVQRQHRSARPRPYCRLQELTIDLRDREFIVMPAEYAANNCEGPCKLPLSTRVSSYYAHTVMLLGVQERGSPLQRPPCCVPVSYSDQLIISLTADGMEIRNFPNMVAKECGCR
ncbi:anti-Mullerian hormone [Willisornis vidua]|uniref:Muellerian-inhibiting factor n=1 Tax=Willisornis vidua TaxID=1566151 RepID=A0ABQ9DKX4_9PASS|nr:anti-Mullerian hormone [Willisornis vidua]